MHTHFETKPKSNAAHATPKDEEKDGGSLLGGIGHAVASGFGVARDAVDLHNAAIGGAADFGRSYADMIDATYGTGNKGGKPGWTNQDWYFHCRANCEAAQRGPGGVAAATAISDAHEWTDQNMQGDSVLDSAKDQKANRYGRMQGARSSSGDCRQLCEKYRPGDNFPDKY